VWETKQKRVNKVIQQWVKNSYIPPRRKNKIILQEMEQHSIRMENKEVKD